MLSWGRVRRALQPLVLRYWLDRKSQESVTTRVQGLDLDVFPGVFHPKYFGSSSILAKFVSSLSLSGKSFLEIGCGCGIVALCAARAGATVTAVDINPDAMRCAAANAKRNRMQIDLRVSDVFSSLCGTTFDVIAWNPPFLPGIPKSLAERAFYGGPNLDVIRKLTSEARMHLNSDGSIYTILSADINIDQVEQLFREQRFMVSRPVTTRWGLGETMVILCAQ